MVRAVIVAEVKAKEHSKLQRTQEESQQLNRSWRSVTNTNGSIPSIGYSWLSVSYLWSFSS